MRLSLAAFAVVTAALLPAVTRSAAAQAAPAAATAADTTAPLPPAVAWPAHPVGTYDLTAAVQGQAMPVVLVISDSAGTPTARFRPEGDAEAHPMTVAVKATDLVLQAPTRVGVMTLVLQRHGDVTTGTGERGGERGTITGRLRG